MGQWALYTPDGARQKAFPPCEMTLYSTGLSNTCVPKVQIHIPGQVIPGEWTFKFFVDGTQFQKLSFTVTP
jgi:hypothetical protein